MTTAAPHRSSGREADGWDEHPRDDRLDRLDGIDRDDIERLDGIDRTTRSGATADGSVSVVEDGVIREAGLRARRRRARYVIVIAACVMALGAGAFVMSGGPGSPSQEGEGEDIGPAAGAAGVDDGEILAQWSELHAGWVYVYTDGRVLSYPDRQAVAGHPNGGILERRLSRHGLEMVRAGEVELRAFLPRSDTLPNSAWRDRTPSDYEPSEFALCHAPPGDRPPRQGLGDPKPIRDLMAGTLQPLLAGTERTFADPAVGPWPAVDCFVLDIHEAEMVWEESVPRDDPAMYASDANYTTLTATDRAELEVVLLPILPHGGFVQWGG